MLLPLLLACAGSDGAPTDETGDTGALVDTADTADAAFACPAGMSPVPTESPAFCIDTYEVAFVDDALVSAPGLDPLAGMSIEEAMAACAASPALDANGDVYAMRRLVTSEEWQDAGDGVLGEGGTRFPWGDEFDDSVCVTLSEGGGPQVDQTQPTGSMPTCVSVFGVYDQVGNLWEWADPGILLDADDAIAAFAAEGYTLAEAEDGAVVVTAGDASEIRLEAVGVNPPTLTITDEGWLEIEATQIQNELDVWFARGYLMTEDLSAYPLAIRFVSTDAEDPSARWRVHTAREYDGRPLPDKRGCAWYTGGETACALSTASYGHLPDFDGTIGFRCVAPPYPM